MKVSYHNSGKGTSANAVVIIARTREFHHDRPDEPFAALPWEDRDSLTHAIVGDLVEQAAALPGADIIIMHPKEERFDDIAGLFPGRVKLHALTTESLARGPAHLLEGEDVRQYQKIVLIAELTPLVPSRLIAKTFAQLGAEEDCIVLGQTREGGCAFLGFRAPQRTLLTEMDNDIYEKADRLLAHLCGQNIIVVPIQSFEGLRTGSQVESLRKAIGALQTAGGSFPRRTEATFRSFEKKYKPRKQPQ